MSLPVCVPYGSGFTSVNHSTTRVNAANEEYGTKDEYFVRIFGSYKTGCLLAATESEIGIGRTYVSITPNL